MWRTRLTDCLRIFTGCRGRSLRIVCGFLPAVVDEAYGLFTDFYRMWGTKLTDFLQICTGFGEGGLRIVYGFGPDLGEKACGLFADFYRMWRTKLTECFRIFTGCKGRSLYELFAHFYRMWWTRLTGCLRIFTGCGGRGLRIVYRFAPDLGEQACGLFMDLGRIWGRRLMDRLRIFTECGGRSLRNVSGFLPDVKDEAYELFANFYRMWWTRLTDCLRIFTGCGGRSWRIVYRFAPDFGGAGLRIVYGFGPDLGEKAYGFGEVWVLEPWSNSQLQLVLKSIGIHTARTYSFLFPLQNRCKGIHCLLSLDPSNELTWATLGWDGYIDDLIVQVFFHISLIVLWSGSALNCGLKLLQNSAETTEANMLIVWWFEWMINQCLMSLVACLVWLVACLVWLVACLVWTGLQLNQVFATRATLLSWFLISCHGIDSTVVVWPNT